MTVPMRSCCPRRPLQATTRWKRSRSWTASSAGWRRTPCSARCWKPSTSTPDPTAADAITAAARQVAETVNAAAIVTYTTSGSTTYRASRERPHAPILGLTANRRTARRLVLAWGVHTVVTRMCRASPRWWTKLATSHVRKGLAEPGQSLVITAGVPFGTPGATNILRLAWVPRGRLG